MMPVEQHGGEAGQQPFGVTGGVFGSLDFDQQRKFIIAQPGQLALFLNFIFEPFPDFLEQLIAVEISQSPGKSLETVEVNKHHCQRPIVFRAFRNCTDEMLGKGVLVRQLGHLIAIGHGTDDRFGTQPLQLCRSTGGENLQE